MLSSTFISFACALATILPTSTRASCADSDVAPSCDANAGNCSRSVEGFIAELVDSLASGEEVSPRNDIFNTLSYGKYCGASTRCIGKNLGVDQLVINGGDYEEGFVPDGCSMIDNACSLHDRCLDSLRNDVVEKGKRVSIPAPHRCECEYKLIAQLAQAKGGPYFNPLDPEFVRGMTSEDPPLCDAGFYSSGGVALGLTAEDVIAAPSCATVAGDCSPGNGGLGWIASAEDGLAAQVAGAYCIYFGELLQDILQALG